jgi:hypothetical protein
MLDPKLQRSRSMPHVNPQKLILVTISWNPVSAKNFSEKFLSLENE